MLIVNQSLLHLFLLVAVLNIWSDKILAQTYQTVYSNRIASFQGYTLRIDSVVSGEDSIFFPMKYIQQIEPGCYTPFGNSWIGKKIIIRPDGMNLFLTKDNDTVKIKTYAEYNESWLAFSDNSIQVIATVSKIDTLSFLGINDSIKWITFQVFDNDMTPVDQIVNEKTILLSKQYGLVHTLSFNYFPYFNNDDLDFFAFTYFVDLYLTGLDPPGLGYTNLTWLEVYDFIPGDELHILNESSSWGLTESYKRTDKTIYRYLTRTDEEQGINYTIERINSRITETESNTSLVYIHDTISTTYEEDVSFSKLPGEPVIIEDYAWTYHLGYSLDVTKTEPSPYEYIGIYDDTCWWEGCCWDGCFPAYTFIKGLGGPYYQCESGFMGFYSEERKLVYYQKGEKIWGNPLIITSTIERGMSERISLFPNPANRHISVSFPPGYLPGKLEIYDVTGRLLFQEEISSELVEIELKGISRGMYWVQFFNTFNIRSTVLFTVE